MNQPVIKKKNSITIKVNGVTRTLDCDKLYSDLNFDIATKVYDAFPKVKDQMFHIMGKVNKLRFVSNAKTLTQGEIKTLIENDYIKK